VHALAAQMLPLWAPFILFDGVQVVFVYALRSLGDQVVTGINSILAFFVVTGGLGLLLVQWGYGPLGLVYASGWGMVAAAALHGGRLLWVNRSLERAS
jgi:MATE family multidrug resistance protein